MIPRDAAALRHATDAYLERCFAVPTPPRVSELAAETAIEAHKLTRIFQRMLRITPSAYLKQQQIACAVDLLRTTNRSLEEIAITCGFGTRVSFFRAFKRAIGKTPAQYRSSLSDK